MSKSRRCFVVTLTLVAFIGTKASAELFDSWGIAANNSGNPVTNQLTVEVAAYGTNQVLFTFNNTGPISSSITDIYFDDGTLLGIANILDNPLNGVDFGIGAIPAELPGGNNETPPFVTTAGFSADSEKPTQQNGVNPSESVGIVFNLQSGKTFDDVLQAIHIGLRPDLYYDLINKTWSAPNLRIGLHVQSIYPTNKSDSYILNPVPGAAILGLLGLGVAGIKLRKFA